MPAGPPGKQRVYGVDKVTLPLMRGGGGRERDRTRETERVGQMERQAGRQGSGRGRGHGEEDSRNRMSECCSPLCTFPGAEYPSFINLSRTAEASARELGLFLLLPA